jgi:hypothetical protein
MLYGKIQKLASNQCYGHHSYMGLDNTVRTNNE